MLVYFDLEVLPPSSEKQRERVFYTDMNKSDKSKQITKPFTVDPTSAGDAMPSVSRLLNRKKLVLSNSSDKKLNGEDPPPPPKFTPLAVPPELPEAPLTFQLDHPEPLEIANSPVLTVRTVNPRSQVNGVTKLNHWKLDSLRTNSDPMGQGLVKLFESGATSALFLAIEAPPVGSKLPLFRASASIDALNREAVWGGLTLNPKWVAGLWNHLISNAYAELGPPGTMTDMQSIRNMIRAAFGVEDQEWLLILRAGPVSACRGILMIISKSTLVDQLPTTLQQITAPLAKKAA